jgi:hypothetical protein
MTFANSVYPRPNFADPKAPDIEGWGVFFFAGNGTLQVNRMGWALRPPVATTRNRVGPEAPPGAGNVQLGTTPAAPGGAGGGRGRGGPGGPGGPGGRGGGKPAVDLHVEINPRGAVEEDYPLHVHTRDFLDKLKAKNRATNAPLEVGYNSALPCVLALEAMQQNRVLGWDATARKSKAI